MQQSVLKFKRAYMQAQFKNSLVDHACSGYDIVSAAYNTQMSGRRMISSNYGRSARPKKNLYRETVATTIDI